MSTFSSTHPDSQLSCLPACLPVRQVLHFSTLHTHYHSFSCHPCHCRCPIRFAPFLKPPALCHHWHRPSPLHLVLPTRLTSRCPFPNSISNVVLPRANVEPSTVAKMSYSINISYDSCAHLFLFPPFWASHSASSQREISYLLDITRCTISVTLPGSSPPRLLSG